MREIPSADIRNRLKLDNPWWENGKIEKRWDELAPRIYLAGLMRLVDESKVNRAVVLMGPRRVGKTVLIKHAIRSLLKKGIGQDHIFWVSVDDPVYTGLRLDQLLTHFQEMHGHGRDAKLYVFFDEIQYHKDWEQHLKVLVDKYPDIRFTVSGSAAAALKIKSRESGAGRFTDFWLPPLNFIEFCKFKDGELPNLLKDDDIFDEENDKLVDYLNYGGFPEAVFYPEVQKNMDRFVADDIIDKVLLRDIPSLYGINNSQELKQLFTMLAYNTGQEMSVPELSRKSQIAANTIKKYLDYLEAAFLITRLYRVNECGKHFKKQSHFKVYLTNPCLRSALFGPVAADSEEMGALVETAIVSHCRQAGENNISYARWKSGEVDIVCTDKTGKIYEIIEVKWSNRALNNPKKELKALFEFFKKAKTRRKATVTTRSKRVNCEIDNVEISFIPVIIQLSFYAIIIGASLRGGTHPMTGQKLSDDAKDFFEVLEMFLKKYET